MGSDSDLVQRLCDGDEPSAEEVEIGAAVHLALVRLEAVDLTFCLVVRPGLPERGGDSVRETAPRIEDAGPSGAPVEVALNRIIRIGPRPNFLETWRCAVTVQGDRFYSTGLTETGARARLQRITDQKFHCRRDRRFS